MRMWFELRRMIQTALQYGGSKSTTDTLNLAQNG